MKKDNGVINLVGKRTIEHGCAGVVYDLGNGTCYKKIYNHEYTNNREKGTILEKIQNMRLFNFCKILEIFYDDEGYVIGYLMPIYQNDNLNILSMPIDYTIDSYRSIYNGVVRLSEEKIYMNDFDFHNVFITNNGIIVYDYDMYLSQTNKESILLRNKARLNILFNQLYKNEALYKYSQYNPMLIDQHIDKLFNAQSNPNTIEKQLSKYNRPIEYLRGSYGKI